MISYGLKEKKRFNISSNAPRKERGAGTSEASCADRPSQELCCTLKQTLAQFVKIMADPFAMSLPIGSTQSETENLNFECRLQRSINRQSNPAIKT